MRTTIDIPDQLYRRLKARAAREGRPAKALILQGVDAVLAAEVRPKTTRVRPPLVGGKHPGTLVIDNARIYDLISFP